MDKIRWSDNITLSLHMVNNSMEEGGQVKIYMKNTERGLHPTVDEIAGQGQAR